MILSFSLFIVWFTNHKVFYLEPEETLAGWAEYICSVHPLVINPP